MTIAQDDDRQAARRRSPMSSAEAALPSSRSDFVESTNADNPGLNWGNDSVLDAAAISPIRKAAIVLVSLEQSLASQLLSHLERTTVEAVTWEIARLDGIDPVERELVLEEFYGLGLRRLCFVFDDLMKMSDTDIRVALDDDDLENLVACPCGGGCSRASESARSSVSAFGRPAPVSARASWAVSAV